MKTKLAKHGSVWMVDQNKSAARAIAEDVMRELGLFEGDFQTRDKIITAVSVRLTGMLDHVAKRKK